MPSSVDDRVLDFYSGLFDSLFSEPFRASISERRRLNLVIRQVEDAADAASSSLTRFFQSQKLSEATVDGILVGFEAMSELLALEDIANSNVTTEEIVENLLGRLPCPQTVQPTHDAVYRLALYTVVQVLMQVGSVMAEWRKLNFSSTFELPRKVVNRLNAISDQMNALGHSGHSGADENYELLYRDYLLQRFHKVEAGTVRMTTSLDVDLRELFVMPRVMARKRIQREILDETDAPIHLMDLATARRIYGNQQEHEQFELSEENLDDSNTEQAPTALEQVKSSARNVIIGLPGAGKSTFFEWLQVKLASVEEQFILDFQQAIPLMLRVRQLDLFNLPQGAALIEKATASRDRADLMPDGWIDRQMKAGKILLMLDGLDETEPELRDKYLMPWLFGLLKQYPKCHYLISSRPVGYPPGLLDPSKFVECDLLDFDTAQIQDYTRHWCTAVRLAQNELEAEARREGEQDGDKIVNGFQEHPYIRNLARNPLMLSAICLVNYFEGGRLPDDRALLYRLCVEGLLHNWDKRRGINSEFGFDEKLRACREVALAMQAEDRAEFEANRVREVFTLVLGDDTRAGKLLEHIRYRTGLLLERRPNVFGFAHLTFQEYLAARGIHEGNRLGIDANQLVGEHDDGRWKEVIALYCGQATTPAVRNLIEQLIIQSDTSSLGEVLTESYFAAGSELSEDSQLRRQVLDRVAITPGSFQLISLNRFKTEEVISIVNTLVGTTESHISVSQSYRWLVKNHDFLEAASLATRLLEGQKLNPNQRSEIIYLLHAFAPSEILIQIAKIPNLYTSIGPSFEDNHEIYRSQAEVALIGLLRRGFHKKLSSEAFQVSCCNIFHALTDTQAISFGAIVAITNIKEEKIFESSFSSWSLENRKMLASLSMKLASNLAHTKIAESSSEVRKSAIDALKYFASLLEGVEYLEKRLPKSATKKQSKLTKSKKR
jgi:NACHT domain